MAVTYEAGPTRFGLYRALMGAGVRCEVAAPSKLQRPRGDRVKTDQRDALHLTRLLRLDEVTSVSVPSIDQEAARDLVRAREDCRGDLMRARHRLSKLLLRNGIVYCGGQAWTGRHDAWLRQQRLPGAATRLAFDSDYDAVLTVAARRGRLDAAITTMAAESEFTPVVHRRGCLRGVSTLTGFALAVEIGDWSRFTGTSIGSYVGLVPCEYSSGTSRVQGGITKTGNGHARRCSTASPPAQVRRKTCVTGGPAPARRARGDAGNRRLHAGGSGSRPNGPWSPTSPSPASWPAGAGPWPSWTDTRRLLDSPAHVGGSAWSDPRLNYEPCQDPRSEP